MPAAAASLISDDGFKKPAASLPPASHGFCTISIYHLSVELFEERDSAVSQRKNNNTSHIFYTLAPLEEEDGLEQKRRVEWVAVFPSLSLSVVTAHSIPAKKERAKRDEGRRCFKHLLFFQGEGKVRHGPRLNTAAGLELGANKLLKPALRHNIQQQPRNPRQI